MFIFFLYFIKVYEISCKIEKKGEVTSEIEVQKISGNEDVEMDVKTNFFIKKYLKNDFNEYEESANETVWLKPGSTSNEMIQFQIWSDHPSEYTHLEECKLIQTNQEGEVVLEEVFLMNGCIVNDWNGIFTNSNERVSPDQNADIFYMRPFVNGCKTKWQILCTTASCSRGLRNQSPAAFQKHCSITHHPKTDKCHRIYDDDYYGRQQNDNSRRKRRNQDEDAKEASVAESQVDAFVEHPCFYVDKETSEYCLDQICWTLAECATVFPDDYPPETGKDAKLKQIIDLIEDLLDDHIDETMSANDEDDEEVFINKITKQAQILSKKIVSAKDDFMDKLTKSVSKRYS